MLRDVIHCHNCSKYAVAGRTLLDREIPDESIAEWQASYQLEKAATVQSSESIITFKLGKEWLAIPVKVLDEITHIKPIHTIPHQKSRAVKGLVNIRGILTICFDLGILLNITNAKNCENQHNANRRLLIINAHSKKYAILVNEATHTSRYTPENLSQTPATLKKDSSNIITGVLQQGNKKVAIIDPELMFAKMEHHLK